MATLVSYNPADGQPVGEVPVTPVDRIPTMVARARAAQPAWAALGPEGRRDALKGAAARMIEAAEAAGRQLTLEMGKPLAEGVGEVRYTGKGLIAELDEMVEAFTAEVVEDRYTRSEMRYEALGVCAAITPWNFPFSMPHWMVLPALMAGNTVILKPSEETPLTAQAYVDLLGADLPEGVLQIAHGADEQGKALVAADVDLIAFTGSRAVGRSIMAAAAGRLTRIILELGGKDPMIVLDDADLDAAARFAARNSFRNAGQVCVSTERIYVPDSVADRFVDALVLEAGKMKVGPGIEDGVRVGPMVNTRQRAHVLTQLAEAEEAGARRLCGGEAGEGAFLTPAVLDGVNHEMGIARDETFGPVACVIRVADDDEAVRLANDTPYGLGAIVFGADEARAAAVADQLRAGMVGINRGVGGAFGTPWVGARQSGFGYHKGKSGHRQFAQVRVISRSRPRSAR